MGCNCGNKKINRNIVKNLNKMAKTKYKVKKGVSEHTTLIYRSEKFLVKDLTQQTMKVLFKAGNPNIEKDETSAKKDK